MSSGLFITFEGGEGAGKTTQARKLNEYLEGKGFEVVLTREPGGTPEAEKIRDLLVQRDSGNWTPITECVLFFAARQMHIETLIKPALADGKIVICDRFTDSTRAYQGHGRDFDLEKIEAINNLVIDNFEPDLTLIFDLPVEEGLKRSLAQKARASGLESTEDKFEKLDRDFHEKMRQGYLTIAKENAHRCSVIDAGRSPDEISPDIIAIVESRLRDAV